MKREFQWQIKIHIPVNGVEADLLRNVYDKH